MQTSNNSPELIPVILCGGSGTRLWPYSRETQPKQFLSFNGKTSLLQDTALRFNKKYSNRQMKSQPIFVTNTEHRFMVASQLEEIGMHDCTIILESVGRNTAPALTLAALNARTSNRDPVLMVMPSDHLIRNLPKFYDAVEIAYRMACSSAIVTFGIRPDRPETGFGYIHLGYSISEGVYGVRSFTEKPDASMADIFVSSGEYLWNSGMYMVRTSVWLRAVEKIRPNMFVSCIKAMERSEISSDFIRPDAEVFGQCESDSIDYAIMEKLSNLSSLDTDTWVVPMDAGWSDIGAWDSVWEFLNKDDLNTAAVGDVLSVGCENTLLFSTSRLVAGIDLDDLIVIETADAVLVSNKKKGQDVKKIVNLLNDKGRTLASMHRKVNRPWGWYDSIDSGPRFQVKHIVVNPGASISLQMHLHRAEHWVVVSGTAEVTNGDNVIILSENESTFIPVGNIHRLKNPGEIPLEIIEIQSGDYLGEDDIVRFQDDYGRKSM